MNWKRVWKSHLNNSLDLEKKLKDLFVDDDHVLLSLDVSSLFTNSLCDLVLKSLDRTVKLHLTKLQIVHNFFSYISNLLLIIMFIYKFLVLRWAHQFHLCSQTHSEKIYFIESKKMICLNDSLWFKEMIHLSEIKFVWFKQNIFEPNKYLFESN